MNCPYCNQEMRLGYIEAQNLLSWTPKEEKSIGLTLWARSLNSIKLAGFPFSLNYRILLYLIRKVNNSRGYRSKI